MTEKNEALRLAYWLERDGANCQQHINAAAELRRLAKVETQRKALLEFAKYVEAIDPGNPAPLFERARAAIAKAEGGQ